MFIVLVERMFIIRMKVVGKWQFLEEKLSDQLEEQRQEQVLQRYCCEVDELDYWLLNIKVILDVVLGIFQEFMDMDVQLVDCQNMLVEIEQKVVVLLQLFVYNENLLLEGKVYIKEEVEQLVVKLRLFKGSFGELQRVLYDRQFDMQGVI